MHSKEQIELCRYRLSKACEYLNDAEKSLGYEMYDTAANRSYYAIFHAVRALLALSGKDFRKHSGVISCFQMDYIKTGIFEKRMSDIIKSAFSLRTESDYEDFFCDLPRGCCKTGGRCKGILRSSIGLYLQSDHWGIRLE